MSQVERIARIHLYLESGRGLSCRQMVEMFEVSEPTAKRDIEFMRDRLGAPIYYDRSRRTYCYEETATQISPWSSRYPVPGLWLSPDEAYGVLTLYNILKGIDPGFMLAFVAPLRLFLKKLLSSTKYPTHGFDKKVSIDFPEFEGGSSASAQRVFRALLASRPIYVQMTSDENDNYRHIIPVHLALQSKGWLLTAKDFKSGETLHLSIGEIADAHSSLENQEPEVNC